MLDLRSGLLALLFLSILGAFWWGLMHEDRPADGLEVQPIETHQATHRVEASDGLVKEQTAARPEAILAVPFLGEEAELRRRFDEPHQPRHGPLLERNRTDVILEVRDRRGQRLQSWGWRSTNEKLWRKEGAHWKNIPIRFDAKAQRLRQRDGRVGLEPGSYELEFAAGSYGKLRSRFEIVRDGETRHLELRLPGWRRVVTFSFVDPEGRPISRLTAPPRFDCARTPRLEERMGAFKVLREPPGGWEVVGVRGVRHVPRRRHLRAGSLWPTDAGRYHVPVIAGVKGTIVIELGRGLYERRRVSFTSEFSGAEWEEYTVVLKRKPDFARKVATYTIRQADDPGNRKAFEFESGGEHAIAGGPSSRGPVSPRHWRLLVELSAPDGVFPLIRRSDHSLRELRRGLDGAWWIDDRLRSTATLLNTTDGRFYRGAPQVVSKSERGSSRRIVRAESASPCRFSLRSTPTLAAWARGVSFALDPRDEALRKTLADCKQQANAAREGIHHVYETWLAAPWREKLAGHARINACFAAKASTLLTCRSSGRQRTTDGGRHFDFALKLDRKERRDLVTGHLELNLRELLSRQNERTLLAFRCVGDREEGIPWVEASVLPAETAELAEIMRRIARTREPEPDPALPCEVAEPEELVEENEGLSFRDDDIPSPEEALARLPDEELRALFGDELFELYGPRALHRLQYHGAWYDSRSKFCGDGDGYLITRRPALKAGRLYVLYLWGKSRDDLEPDRRIVFQATAGITDLGVIRLRSH